MKGAISPSRQTSATCLERSSRSRCALPISQKCSRVTSRSSGTCSGKSLPLRCEIAGLVGEVVDVLLTLHEIRWRRAVVADHAVDVRDHVAQTAHRLLCLRARLAIARAVAVRFADPGLNIAAK